MKWLSVWICVATGAYANYDRLPRSTLEDSKNGVSKAFWALILNPLDFTICVNFAEPQVTGTGYVYTWYLELNPNPVSQESLGLQAGSGWA